MAEKSDYLIAVRDLIGKSGAMRELSRDMAAPEHYGEAVARVHKATPLQLEGRLESVHEGILATGEVNTLAAAECVRCLEPIQVSIVADFQELFAYSDQDGYDYQVVDESIDLEPIVRDQVVLQLPLQPMCSPECPGLDPVTGDKRPHGWQDDPTERIDPRWDALRELMDQDLHSDNETSRE